MHVAFVEAGQHQLSTQIDPFLRFQRLRFFIASHKADSSVFDAYGLSHRLLLIHRPDDTIVK